MVSPTLQGENNGEVISDLNKDKKRDDLITFSLTKDAPELAKLVADSNALYHHRKITAKNFISQTRLYWSIHCVVLMFLMWFTKDF